MPWSLKSNCIVTEESHCDRNSPIVHGHKMDWTIHDCVEFCKANTFSKLDVLHIYSVPRIDEHLDHPRPHPLILNNSSEIQLSLIILVQFYTHSVVRIPITIQFDAAFSREKRTTVEVFSCGPSSVEDLYLGRAKTWRKRKMFRDTFHLANYLFQNLPSGKWFWSLITKTVIKQVA